MGTPPGDGGRGNLMWEGMWGDFIYVAQCVGYTTNQAPAQLGKGGTPHEFCQVAGLLGTPGENILLC